jgi:hypothetical protein
MQGFEALVEEFMGLVDPAWLSKQAARYVPAKSS